MAEYKKKTIIYDGETFDSKLELNTYKEFKKAGIQFKFQPKTFILNAQVMNPKVPIWEKYGKRFIRRHSIEAIKYTPDFGPPIDSEKSYYPRWIVETKGHKTPQYRLRKRIFLNYLLKKGADCAFFAPSNLKEVKETIELIKLIDKKENHVKPVYDILG